MDAQCQLNTSLRPRVPVFSFLRIEWMGWSNVFDCGEGRRPSGVEWGQMMGGGVCEEGGRTEMPILSPSLSGNRHLRLMRSPSPPSTESRICAPFLATRSHESKVAAKCKDRLVAEDIPRAGSRKIARHS